MNSKERLKRQGGEMSGRRPLTFDEAITFPLVMLAFGGAISSLMTEQRCAYVTRILSSKGELVYEWTCGGYKRDHPTGLKGWNRHKFVPPKGES